MSSTLTPARTRTRAKFLTIWVPAVLVLRAPVVESSAIEPLVYGTPIRRDRERRDAISYIIHHRTKEVTSHFVVVVKHQLLKSPATECSEPRTPVCVGDTGRDGRDGSTIGLKGAAETLKIK